MQRAIHGIWHGLGLLRYAIAAIMVGAVFTWQGATTQAGIYSVRLLPSVIQANVGGSFTVDLKANMVVDSAATGRVTGSVTYPSDLVQLQSVVSGDYPEVSITTGAGLITVSSPDKGSGNGYGGQKVLFTATFTAIAGGNASFAATNGVMVVNGTNHVVVAGSVQTIGCQPGYTGTYPNCIAPVTPPQPPEPTPTPPSTTTPSATPTTQADSQTASPKTSASQQQTAAIAPQTSGASTVTLTELAHDTTPTSIHVSLQTSGALHNMQLSYGASKDALSQTGTPTQTGDTIDVEFHGLEPSTVYYFKLTALDSSNKDLTYQTGYQTKGYPIKVALAGTGQKLAGRLVTIDDTEFTSDADGTITAFLSPNDYIVTDKETGRTLTITVVRATVTGGQEPAVQQFSLQLAAKQQRTEPWILTASGAAVVALTATSVYFFRRHHGKQSHAMGHGAWETQPYVPTQKPKEHYMAPVSAAPQSVVQPSMPTSEEEDEFDEVEADDSSMLWNRKTLPTVQDEHSSPYVDTDTPALGAHTKDHRPKPAATHGHSKIKGVRARAETKLDSDSIDPDEA